MRVEIEIKPVDTLIDSTVEVVEVCSEREAEQLAEGLIRQCGYDVSEVIYHVYWS